MEGNSLTNLLLFLFVIETASETFDCEVVAYFGVYTHDGLAHWHILLRLFHLLVVDESFVCLIDSEENVFDKVLLSKEIVVRI